MQEMFHDTAGFTSELWKPDYPAEDLRARLRRPRYRTGQTTTPTSRIIGLPSTQHNPDLAS